MERAIAALLGNKAAPLIMMGSLLLILFISPLRWLAQSLYAPEYRLHSLLLIGFVIFFSVKNCRQNFGFQKFEITLAPLLLFILGLIGFITTEKFFDIDVISCLFFGLTIYGFIGFVIDRNAWKNSSVFALLFFLCLPLSYHIETFLGFPLRILSAKIATNFFSLAGSQVHSTETILLIENKLTNIDLPCSGIKSLWSISLFALILSIIEKYRINLAWILSFIGGWFLAISANIFRIIILVAIYGSELPDNVKASLHAPVGVVGFIAACAITYLMFEWTCQQALTPVNISQKRFDNKSFLFVVLILLIAIAINKIQPAAAGGSLSRPTTPSSNDSLELTDKEKDLFFRHEVIQYDKRKFEVMGLRGTAFMVLSNSWRGQHHPEQCLQGQGGVIDSTRTLMIDNDLRVRAVSLKNSNNEVVYWFQSHEDSTDDYSSRVWAGLLHPRRPYTMVILYIENGATAEPSAFKNLINNFHHQAQVMLNNERKSEK